MGQWMADEGLSPRIPWVAALGSNAAALHIRKVHPLLYCRWSTEVLTNSTSFDWASDSDVFLEHRISSLACLQYPSQWLEIEYNVASRLIFRMNNDPLIEKNIDIVFRACITIYYFVMIKFSGNVFILLCQESKQDVPLKKKNKNKGCQMHGSRVHIDNGLIWLLPFVLGCLLIRILWKSELYEERTFKLLTSYLFLFRLGVVCIWLECDNY